jgi:Rad3-related DNA helicase
MNILCTPNEAKSRLSKFRDYPFRIHQPEAIEFATQSTKRFRVLAMPTGGGKSLVGMACGVMACQANYLCSTKILQNQLVADFPESKALFGRNNYECLLDRSKFCDTCASTESNPCQYSDICIYRIEKQKAIASSLRTLNYKYFLVEAQFSGRFSGTPLTIIDEVDALEGTLIGHIALQFTERSLFRLGMESGPSRKTVTAKDGLESWKEFGLEAMKRSLEISSSITKEIESFDKITEDWQFQKLRERDHYFHLYERSKMFIDNVDRDWIMEATERQGSRQAITTFRPLWITPELAETFLWSKADNFLLMSATMLPKQAFCKTLGLDSDEVDWMSVPSTFPIENRPIHIWPVASVTNKTLDTAIPQLAKGINEIFKLHPHSHGIIQGVSYSLCKRVSEEMKSDRIIIHTPQDRQEVLDRFVESKDNTVVMSPSIERGLSLEGSKCEFVVWIKAPFLSLVDRVVSQRLYSGSIGKLWYRASMMLSVVQGCGRGMRSKSDHCVCYLIDWQINKAYMENPSLWPDWFRDAVSWTDAPWGEFKIDEK